MAFFYTSLPGVSMNVALAADMQNLKKTKKDRNWVTHLSVPVVTDRKVEMFTLTTLLRCALHKFILKMEIDISILKIQWALFFLVLKNDFLYSYIVVGLSHTPSSPIESSFLFDQRQGHSRNSVCLQEKIKTMFY